MVTASQLRPGMAIRFEGQTYRVAACDYHPGQGKMGGTAHVRLENLSTGTFRETSLRAELRLEERPVTRQTLSFLYSDADQSWFMDPASYEQVGIPNALLGEQARFLQPEMLLPVEFLDGRPINVTFPEILEVRIAETAPPAHQQADSAWKPATLENGVGITVPQFIKSQDIIRLDVANLRYMDRVKGAGR